MRKLALLVSALAATASPVHGQTTPAAQVLDRASRYVRQFVEQFSHVVAEERSVQESHPLPNLTGVGPEPSVERVELQSDLLCVRVTESDEWLLFRDVFAVNHHPVRDRQERLEHLFVAQPADAIDQAWRIARESSRYNVGPRWRTIGAPLLALTFLQDRFRDRFEFTLQGIDTSRGPDIWMLRFKERRRPTIIRSPANRDVPANGRLWIDGATGRVLQTDLVTGADEHVMTTFAADERLHLDVPVKMREVYWFGATRVTSESTYTNFRRFDVVTAEDLR